MLFPYFFQTFYRMVFLRTRFLHFNQSKVCSEVEFYLIITDDDTLTKSIFCIYFILFYLANNIFSL